MMYQLVAMIVLYIVGGDNLVVNLICQTFVCLLYIDVDHVIVETLKCDILENVGVDVGMVLAFCFK
jgi:hypothetical protein